MKPRILTDRYAMQTARRERDFHWALMERMARRGIVHICPWDKKRLATRQNEHRCGLIDWFELAAWLRQHRSWFGQGAFNRARDTFPCWLTPRGRAALRKRRRRDDLAPVLGGLVEPGFQVQPREFYRCLWEQRKNVLTKARGYRRTDICLGELRIPYEPMVFKPQRRRSARRKAA